MDLVSIIIPVYNGKKFLEKCLDSILSQTYKNIEIILVNDGSTDSSEVICRNYAEQDDRIVFVSKENGGVSTARNIGLNKATGKYICFVDSDDYVEPTFVEVLYNGFKNSDCVISACNIFSPSTIDEKYSEGEKFHSYVIQEAFYQMCRNSIIYPFIWNKMFLADVIKENNLMFDTQIIYGEDTMFLLNYYSCVYTQKLYYAGEEKLYHYVVNPNSAMASRAKNGFTPKWFDQVKCLERAEQFALSKGLDEFAKTIRIRKYRVYAFLSSLFVATGYRGKEYKELKLFLKENLAEFLKSDYYDDKTKKDLKLCAKSPYLYHYKKRILYLLRTGK